MLRTLNFKKITYIAVKLKEKPQINSDWHCWAWEMIDVSNFVIYLYAYNFAPLTGDIVI
jgi:hypothetical protein